MSFNAFKLSHELNIEIKDKKICKEHNIPNEFIGHNVLVDGIEHFEGVVSRSNYNEYWTDINPSFKFELLCEKEH